MSLFWGGKHIWTFMLGEGSCSKYIGDRLTKWIIPKWKKSKVGWEESKNHCFWVPKWLGRNRQFQIQDPKKMEPTRTRLHFWESGRTRIGIFHQGFGIGVGIDPWFLKVLKLWFSLKPYLIFHKHPVLFLVLKLGFIYGLISV